MRLDLSSSSFYQNCVQAIPDIVCQTFRKPGKADGAIEESLFNLSRYFFAASPIPLLRRYFCQTADFFPPKQEKK
jgi:hypothetical protein